MILKIAFLVDVYMEDVNTFNQEIEEVINRFGGRLIYRYQSRNPIRILPAEIDKYPPDHTPVPFSQGEGVKNARWSFRRTLDGACNFCNDHADRCGGPVYAASGRSRGLRSERNNVRLDSANGRPDSRRGWNASRFRVRIPSARTRVGANENRNVSHVPVSIFSW